MVFRKFSRTQALTPQHPHKSLTDVLSQAQAEKLEEWTQRTANNIAGSGFFKSKDTPNPYRQLKAVNICEHAFTQLSMIGRNQDAMTLSAADIWWNLGSAMSDGRKNDGQVQSEKDFYRYDLAEFEEVFLLPGSVIFKPLQHKLAALLENAKVLAFDGEQLAEWQQFYRYTAGEETCSTLFKFFRPYFLGFFRENNQFGQAFDSDQWGPNHLLQENYVDNDSFKRLMELALTDERAYAVLIEIIYLCALKYPCTEGNKGEEYEIRTEEAMVVLDTYKVAEHPHPHFPPPKKRAGVTPIWYCYFTDWLGFKTEEYTLKPQKHLEHQFAKNHVNRVFNSKFAVRRHRRSKTITFRNMILALGILFFAAAFTFFCMYGLVASAMMAIVAWHLVKGSFAAGAVVLVYNWLHDGIRANNLHQLMADHHIESFNPMFNQFLLARVEKVIEKLRDLNESQLETLRLQLKKHYSPRPLNSLTFFSSHSSSDCYRQFLKPKSIADYEAFRGELEVYLKSKSDRNEKKHGYNPGKRLYSVIIRDIEKLAVEQENDTKQQGEMGDAIPLLAQQ